MSENNNVNVVTRKDIQLPSSPKSRKSNQTSRSESWVSGRFLCWGSGKHGQHSHNVKDDVCFGNSSVVEEFSPTNRDTNVTLVACGSSHSIVVTQNNCIFVWGNNHCGQLGCGDDKNHPTPVQISLYSVQRENPDVAGVACGARHTFVWLQNGNVFSFGNNMFGQLAYDVRIKDFRENQKTPHLLRGLSHRQVQQVACGEKHTLILFRGGHVAAVGNNTFGQLGNNSRNEAVVPINLVDIPPIKYVAAGAFHSVVIDVTGEIWCWGFSNACGRSKEDGDLLQPERYTTRHPNIVQVDCGQGHNAALSANGTVYTWGHGTEGQLGQGPDVTILNLPTKLTFADASVRIARIRCGENYTLAISESGALYIWGKGSHVINTTQGMSSNCHCPQLLSSDSSPVLDVFCGAWHAAAITGKPDWEKEDNSSDIEDNESLVMEDQKGPESEMELDMLSHLSHDDTRIGFSREKTTISLADFYAPSPTPRKDKTVSNVFTGRKMLPAYLEPRKKNIQIPNFNKKSQVVWKPAPPQKGKVHVHKQQQVSELGTIEQSSASTINLKKSKQEKSLPSKSVKSLDMRSEHTNETVNGHNNEETSLPHINGAIVMNTKHESWNSTTPHDISEDSNSVTSNKSYKTCKSQVAEKMKDKMSVKQQAHHLEGQSPRSNYTHARQPSPLKLRNNRSFIESYNKSNAKISNNNNGNSNTRMKLYSRQSTDLKKKYQKFGVVAPPPTTKLFISSTRLDFISPEPIMPPHPPVHPLKLRNSMGRNSRHVTRSQPDSLQRGREDSFYIGGRKSDAGGRTSGDSYYTDGQMSEGGLNKIVGGTYDRSQQHSSLMQTPDGNRLSPTMTKLSDATAIAQQRLNAKNRIQRSLIDHQNGKLRGSNMNSLMSSRDDLERNIKRSYALPRRITFLASNLITRQQNVNLTPQRFLNNGGNTWNSHQLPRTDFSYLNNRDVINSKKTFYNGNIK